MKWKNLAQHIIRQRLIIEATTKELIKPEEIKEYLSKLAEVSKMRVMKEPVISSAHEMGWGGWIHWKFSGAHFYSYPAMNGNPALFTLDTYTCKPFSIKEVIEFTKKFFNPIEIVWKEVDV